MGDFKCRNTPQNVILQLSTSVLFSRSDKPMNNSISFYSVGGHFLFYLTITAFITLFVDLSPIQKHPISKINYLITSVLAAAIPCLLIYLIHISPLQKEMFIGVFTAIAASIAITLTIQRFFDINIDY